MPIGEIEPLKIGDLCIDGLVQECSNSSALEMELLQFSTKPLVCPNQHYDSLCFKMYHVHYDVIMRYLKYPEVSCRWYRFKRSTANDNRLCKATKSVFTWWRHQMETFSALLAICAGNSPVPVEFPTQRPVTRSFDVYFDLRPNKRLSKQSWGWWFETQSRPLWRHRNVSTLCYTAMGCAWWRFCLEHPNHFFIKHIYKIVIMMNPN